MEEKFSVSLELMIQKFKDKAKQVQDVSKNVASKIKENMSVDVGGGAFKKMSAESELLLNKINDIKATLSMAKTDSNLFSKTEVLEMTAELEKLENQYTKINQKSNMFSSSFNKIQDGMNKSLKSAKRFTLSLFGIQSIYRMLSRASSAYLAQDEETSSKIQSAWIGLGSIFAPLLQTIANFAIKAVSYINVFIKALTGTDFLANAMAKSMDKASKKAGKLSKILAGFDELTNLDDSAGGASVDTSWIDAFKNVELDPKITEFFQNLGEKLKPKSVKNFWKDIHKFWEKDWKNYFQNVEGNWSLFIEGIGSTIKGFYDIFKGIFDTIVGIVKSFVGIFTGDMTVLRDGWEQLCNGLWGMLKGAFEIIYGIIGMALGIIKGIFLDIVDGFYTTIIKPIGNSFVGLWNGIKNVFSNVGDFFKGVFKGVSNIIEGAFSGVGGFFSNLWYGIKYGVISMANFIISAINGMVKGVLAPLNVLINGINSLTGGKTKKLSFPISNISLPRLDTGTPYVERSGYAEIHEGEAVVPKRFNSDEYFSRLGGSNNEQTNKLLEELIDTLERKDMNAYISESSIGKASQNYRNLQSRIIGEELI